MGRSKLTPREEALKPIIAGNIKKERFYIIALFLYILIQVIF